jgi:hypothetical protein
MPQLSGSSSVFTHAPVHSEKPALQIWVQAPFEHAGVAFAAVGHTRSHCPQCSLLVSTFTQVPPHSSVGETHSVSQVPPTQMGRAGQTLPQLPQFEVSVLVSTHEPLHSVVPDAQPPVQLPSAHTVPAAQARVQLPQCVASVCRFTQAPSQGE